MNRSRSRRNSNPYFRPHISTPHQQYAQNTASVHDTLTDIDAAISEINGQHSNNNDNNTNANGNHRLANPSPLQHSQEFDDYQPNHNHHPPSTPQQQQYHSHHNPSNGSSIDLNMLQHRPGMPSFDNIPDWTPEQVQKYFEARGYDPSVSEQFVIHKITGGILLELELSYLKEIDIASFGTRFEISKDIKHLNAIVRKVSSPPAPSPASIRRQSMSHQYTRASGTRSNSQGSGPPLSTTSPQMPPPTSAPPSASTSTAAPVLNNRSSSLGSEDHSRVRHHSFDRNWSLPSGGVKRSASTGTTNQDLPNGGVLQSPLIGSSANGTIAEQPHLEQSEQQQQSHHRKTSSNNKRSSYVEDSRRRRMHSRDTSFDTIRAVEDRHVAPEDGSGSKNVYNEARHSRSTSNVGANEFRFLNKRHSHSGSQGAIDPEDIAAAKSHKRRSSMLSALMGSGLNTGGLGSQPSSPRQANNNNTNDDDIHANGGGGYGVNYYDSPITEDEAQTPNTLDSDTQLSEATAGSGGSGSGAGTPTGSGHSKKNSMPDDQPNNKKGFGRMKTLRQASSQHNMRRPLQKQKTSAFLEGIRQITAEDAAKEASHSGWMHKRGGLSVGAWRSRYFTLHGTRLSYFTNLGDTKERGLIDITSHRVLAAKENDDKLVAIYAASVGAGRHVFKLVPPAPGTKKGVTFTAPKVHYFAVETKQEMRAWMAAIMKATIDRDESVPVISSCATPTVSLPKAQELFAEARARDEDLRSKMIAGGLSNMPNANAAAAAAAAKQQQAAATFSGLNNGNHITNSDPESPGSSLRSSQTGSSATNSSSLRATSSASPKDFAANGHTPGDLRHLTAKTAGLKIVTDLENGS